jgi:DNA-binding MarR family transcriptional regulator
MAEDFISSLGLAFTAHRLRRLADTFVEATGHWLAAKGLVAPPRSISTLRLLLEQERLSITEIATRLRLSHPFIIRMVSDLERLDLVEVARDRRDARRRLVHLTRKGRAEARALSRTAKPLADAYASLSADAGVDLSSVLTALEQAHRTRSLFDRLAKTHSARLEDST